MASDGDRSYLEASLHQARTSAAKAPEVHLSRGLMAKGAVAGAARSASGGRGSSQAGGGGGLGMSAFDRNGDPAVTGEFERHAEHGILGIPYPWSGGLTEKGQADKADYDVLQKGGQLYYEAQSQGASRQEAFQHAVAGVPALPAAMMRHQDAMKIFATADSIHDFMGGLAQKHYGNLVNGGKQQIVTDDQGKASLEDVPGAPPTPPTFVPGAENPTVLTSNGQGGFVGKPLTDAGGQPVLGKTAPVPGAPVPSDLGPGVPPQITGDTPKRAMTAKEQGVIRSAPAIMDALDKMLANADGMGPGAGFVRTKAGEFLGTNKQGIGFKSGLDTLMANAPLFEGSGYRAAIQALTEAAATPNNAPAFIKAQVGNLKDMVREQTQITADLATRDTEAKLPATVANPLIKAGIIPNGYQNQATINQMNQTSPGSGSVWKMRNVPTAMTADDKRVVGTMMANGGFGPLDDPKNLTRDAQSFLGIMNSDRAAAAQKVQQAQATTTGARAQQNPQPAVPSGNGQPSTAPTQQQQQQQPATHEATGIGPNGEYIVPKTEAQVRDPNFHKQTMDADGNVAQQQQQQQTAAPQNQQQQQPPAAIAAPSAAITPMPNAISPPPVPPQGSLIQHAVPASQPAPAPMSNADVDEEIMPRSTDTPYSPNPAGQ